MKAFGGRGIRGREGRWLEGEEEREIWDDIFGPDAKGELSNGTGMGKHGSRWANS